MKLLNQFITKFKGKKTLAEKGGRGFNGRSLFEFLPMFIKIIVAQIASMRKHIYIFNLNI